MYFCFGWPKLFSIEQRVSKSNGHFEGISNQIVDIKYNFVSRSSPPLVAVITPSEIFMWSGEQQRIILGSYKRKEESLETDGYNSSCLWSVDSSSLAVLTTKGFIYFFKLKRNDTIAMDNFKYIFNQTPSHSNNNPNSSQSTNPNAQYHHIIYQHNSITEEHLLNKINIEFRNSIDVGAVCFTSTTIALRNSFHFKSSLDKRLKVKEELDYIYICSGDGKLIEMNWNAEILHSIQIHSIPFTNSNIQQSFSNLYGTFISFSLSMKMFGIVFSNGLAAVIHLQGKNRLFDSVSGEFINLASSSSSNNNNNGTNNNNINGNNTLNQSISSNASCIALNPRNQLAAIGCDNGEVLLYRIQGLKYERKFSLVAWGIIHLQTGGVNSLEWTPDWCALAIGWQNRGLSLMSIYGCRLMCTIPQLESYFIDRERNISTSKEGNSNRKEVKTEKEPLRSGVSCLAWGPEGYHLLVACRSPSNSENSASKSIPTTADMSGKFIQFSFMKSCLTTNPNMNGSEKIVIQGEDRIKMINYKGSSSSLYSFASNGQSIPALLNGNSNGDSSSSIAKTSSSELDESSHSEDQEFKSELDEINWSHFLLPTTYMADNWPLKYVNVNREGTQIACAGKRGITIFNIATKKWKLFGDRNQEQAIVCCGISWFKNSVIIASSSLGNGIESESTSFEILFYPKNHLDKSSLLNKTNIPEGKKPSFIDCNDQFLIVFTTDSFFFQYLISPSFKTGSSSEISSIKLDLIHQISMNEITESVPPLSITLLPSISLNFKTTSSTSCLMLSASGQLILCAIEDNKQVILANNVEQYWIANYISSTASDSSQSDGTTELENTLWAYGQDGLQVWFPFFTGSVLLQHQDQFFNQQVKTKGPLAPTSTNTGSSSSKLMSREKSLEFDLEVYPIGFIPELGVIVGLTQEVSLLNNSSYVSIVPSNNSSSLRNSNGNSNSTSSSIVNVYFPSFDFKIKTHPFLHTILRHLLEDGKENKAINIARKFSFIPHFAHSLELLLHETLEDEYSNLSILGNRSKSLERSGSGNNIANIPTSPLQKIIKFLQVFPQYPDIVMNCARKTDPAVWPFLFKHVGSPKFLFDQCIFTKRLRTAASYLRILQLLEGMRESRVSALKLLDESLQIDDLELIEELMRFLEPHSEHENKGFTSSKEELEAEIHDISLTSEDQDYYLQELLLGRYARKLLLRFEVLKLFHFAQRINRELKSWLIRERRRAAVIDSHDWDLAFAKLHAQFGIFPPSVSDVDYFIYTHMNISSDPKDIFNACTLKNIERFGAEKHNILLLIQKAMEEAQCHQWILLISTVLLDISRITELISRHPNEWKPYHKTLLNQNNAGYQHLIKALEKTFRSIS